MEGWKWREDEEEGIGSYRMTLRKREDTVKKERRSTRSHCVENSALKEAVDFPQNR
jgi:hypothetical protein